MRRIERGANGGIVRGFEELLVDISTRGREGEYRRSAGSPDPRHAPSRRTGPSVPLPDCGPVPLSRDAARGKMEALAAGAAIVRRELGA